MTILLRATAGLCLCLTVGCVWLRNFSGLQNETASPGGEYVAVVRTSGSMSAMDSDSSMVQIKSRWQWGRDLVFQTSGDGTQISLSWGGPKQLNILCHHCTYAHIDYQQSNWHDVTVTLKSD